MGSEMCIRDRIGRGGSLREGIGGSHCDSLLNGTNPSGGISRKSVRYAAGIENLGCHHGRMYSRAFLMAKIYGGFLSLLGTNPLFGGIFRELVFNCKDESKRATIQMYPHSGPGYNQPCFFATATTPCSWDAAATSQRTPPGCLSRMMRQGQRARRWGIFEKVTVTSWLKSAIGAIPLATLCWGCLARHGLMRTLPRCLRERDFASQRANLGIT